MARSAIRYGCWGCIGSGGSEPSPGAAAENWISRRRDVPAKSNPVVFVTDLRARQPLSSSVLLLKFQPCRGYAGSCERSHRPANLSVQRSGSGGQFSDPGPGQAARGRQARAASEERFGSGLERLSQVKMSYFQRETRELVNLDSCELIHSQFGLLGDYGAASRWIIWPRFPSNCCRRREPNERYFRLLLTVLEHLRSRAPGSVWRAVTYFSLWAVRLAGILPELHVCLACGTWLDNPEAPERAFFSRYRTGLFCGHCRRTAELGKTWELSLHIERRLPRRCCTRRSAQLTRADGGRKPPRICADFLVQQIENHIERRLITAPALEAA